MKKLAVISLSGGMDSTALLIRLLTEEYNVYALSFNYGQKHIIELERLKQNIEYLKSKGFKIQEYNIIDLSYIGKIFNSSLLQGNSEVPVGHYEDENMKSTVVPNRNTIFSSIIFGYALSLSNKFKKPVEICLGVHSGDHSIYPDCRPEFYTELEKVFKLGNWDAEQVNFKLPYLDFKKYEILKDCLENCEKLNLDFDTVMRNTITSYNPTKEGLSSGTSGSDIERIEAFLKIGRKDPIDYELGWEKTVQNVWEIISKK